MPNLGYIDTAFASSGTTTTVPDTVQGDGSVSYAQGYGPNYTLLSSNPSYLPIDQPKFNQLFYDVTSAIQLLQQNGCSNFITTAMNGGTAYSYNQGATVLYSGVVYVSLVAANVTTPPGASWMVLGSNTAQLLYPGGTIGGTANAITAVATGFSLANNYGLVITPTSVNTGATTLNANSTGAIAILKSTNIGLVALTGGELQIGQQAVIIYNGTNHVLINPSFVNPVKAWGAFSGGSTGVAPSLVGGLGIASCSWNSTGNYTLTLNTGVVPDANYAVLLGGGPIYGVNDMTTLKYTINSATSITINTDGQYTGGSGAGTPKDIAAFSIQILHT